MQKTTISFDLFTYESLDALSPEDKQLMSTAVEARLNAYAPYSNFQVGAAVLLESGEVVIGNNQENACYPSGLCAERVAVFQAGAQFPGRTIKAIAISATAVNQVISTPAAPCGNCRQAISEYETRQKTPIAILMMGAAGKVHKCNSLGDLLPLAFNSSFLT